MIQFNEFQTQVTEEFLAQFPQEVIDEFWGYYNDVPFIRNLTAKDRPRAKDLPRDSKGRIIVDISNPHILEDMDYFRETCLHYEKYGTYTNLKVNKNPHSEYMKWYKREIKRCWEGMVRPSDGEWIPGNLYFYLNYFPIKISRIKKGSKIADRVIAHPEVWEGVYLRYHYWHQARFGGKYDWNGAKHSFEIASRGKAHPKWQVVNTPDGKKLWGDIKVGDRLYGIKDDIVTVTDIPFNAVIDIYEIELNDNRKVYSSKEHLWNVINVTTNELSTISLDTIMNNIIFYNAVYAIPKHTGIGSDLFESSYVEIKNITLHSKTDSKCVTVDASHNSYLIGDYIQTHNSKSYSVAADMLRDFSLGESYKNSSNRTALVIAEKETFLIDDGTLNKFSDGLKHLKDSTQFPSSVVKENWSDMIWQCGWKDSSNNIRGNRNILSALAIAGDANKVRGKRSSKQYFEEYASFAKFGDTYNTSIPNVQEGNIVFGQNIGIATGGTQGATFEGALEMINYPSGYNIYALPNIYDRGSNGSKESLFFFPFFMNLKPFYNENGVSDIVAAMFEELQVRYEIKYNSSDPMALTRRKAEFAFTIKDAIMRRDSTIYPVADINDRLNVIDGNATILQDMYIGRLEPQDGKIVWKPDSDLSPVMQFPHKDNKLKGCVYIKEMPVPDSDGLIPRGRYIAGNDPIDSDNADTLSLCSCYVLDLWTDDIVAEYVGREDFVDDSFEIVRRLLLFYNAECNYEKNKKGLYKHFSQMNSLYLLSDTLDYLSEKSNNKILIGNNSKGTNASAPIKRYGRRAIRDYLLKPVQVDDDSPATTNLHRIKFRALLQELAMMNDDGNFDRHDALLMLMLLREDKLRLSGGGFNKNKDEDDKDYLGNDPFFTINYKTPNDSITEEILKKIDNRNKTNII